MEILPKAITNHIIVVYTNCEDGDLKAFHHESLNEILGLQNDVVIPYVCVENVLATNLYGKLIYGNKTKHQKLKTLKNLEIMAEILKDDFFERIKGWRAVPKREFEAVYEAIE